MPAPARLSQLPRPRVAACHRLAAVFAAFFASVRARALPRVCPRGGRGAEQDESAAYPLFPVCRIPLFDAPHAFWLPGKEVLEY